MLEKIDIQNYAIIERTEIPFAAGLTTITGETGAGKSIILGALGLIMGKRADTKVLLDPDQKCVVEALFTEFSKSVIKVLEEADLDVNEHLIIRREILPAGKSRAFVNDTPTTLDVLNQLSSFLLDLHQQWDNMDIHEEETQMNMLDAFVGLQSESEKYKGLFSKWKKANSQLQALENAKENEIKETEFTNYLLDEFQQISPVAGELKSLEEESEWLENSQRIQEVFQKLQHVLIDQEPSVSGILADSLSDMQSIKNIKDSYNDIYTRLQSTWEELKDLAREASNHTELGDLDPQRAQEVRERLSLLYKLQKKHNVNDEESLFQVWENLQEKSQKSDKLDEEINNMKSLIKSLEQNMEESAVLIRKNRQKAIPTLESGVKELLDQLKMEHALFKVELTTLPNFSALGKDAVRWLFAANKGSQLQPIKNVASGGEVSRLNLCIKSVLANKTTLPTLIFDEIDAGVSGDVANKMGELIHGLSKNHQIITITHSPQVAAKANQHAFVFKDNSGQKTITRIKFLEGEERVKEIAVMLSTDPPPLSALETARQLIQKV